MSAAPAPHLSSAHSSTHGVPSTGTAQTRPRGGQPQPCRKMCSSSEWQDEKCLSHFPWSPAAGVTRQHSSGLGPPFLLLTQLLTNSHISGQRFSSVTALKKAPLTKMAGFQGVRGSPCCQSQTCNLYHCKLHKRFAVSGTF